MAGASDWFSIGSTVLCKTCHEKEIEGEVLAFDPQTKMLILSILFSVATTITTATTMATAAGGGSACASAARGRSVNSGHRCDGESCRVLTSSPLAIRRREYDDVRRPRRATQPRRAWRLGRARFRLVSFRYRQPC